MNLDERYQTICAEIGHLEMEIERRASRLSELRAEAAVLRRMAVDINRAKPMQAAKPPDEGEG